MHEKTMIQAYILVTFKFCQP